MAATQALSSRKRERMKPSVSSTRGSKDTKSPTRIPSSSTSCSLLTRASRRISIPSSSRLVSNAFIPCTCAEAVLTSSEPRIFSPVLVWTQQPSASTAGSSNPPMRVMARRPLLLFVSPTVLISLTIAPSVSTWAVRARGDAEDAPSQTATSAPLRVRVSLSWGKAESSSSTKAMACSVKPVGEGMWSRSTKKFFKYSVSMGGNGMFSPV